MVAHRSIYIWLTLGILGGLADRACSTFEQFGCTFKSKNYFVSTKSIYSPVYGKEVQPMHFKNVNQFNVFMTDVKEKYAKVMEDLVFTTFPMYYDFFEYTTRPENAEAMINKSSKLFKDYVPKFFPKQGKAGMAIELLKRLIRKHPNMAESAYLITVDETATDRDLNELNIDLPSRGDPHELLGVPSNPENNIYGEELYDSPRENLLQKILYTASDVYNTVSDVYTGLTEIVGLTHKDPCYKEPSRAFQHSHVAAVVRIHVGNSRLGYVVMDPGFAYSNPVVIMEDKKLPHSPATRKGDGENHTFRHFEGDYIVAIETSKNNYRYWSRLYYVGKPYCSFLMTTWKPALMHSILAVVRRNSEGDSMAYIYFDPIYDSPDFYLKWLPGNRSKINFKDFNEKNKAYQIVKKQMQYEPLDDIIRKMMSMDNKNFKAYMWWLMDYVQKQWEAFSYGGKTSSI